MLLDSKLFATVLDLIPQKTPFRYIDDILELGENAIIASYRFRKDELFYKGHFPDNPVTPGVILIETMAQAGVVALGIYQLIKEGHDVRKIKNITPLFAFVDKVEFSGIVEPGEKVIVKARKIYFRRGNIKSQVTIERENNDPVCCGQLTGSGVRMNEK